MSDPNPPPAVTANPNIPSAEVIREFPDRGAQWLLEDPRHLRDLLQLVEPDLAARLEVDRAQRINRTLIPPDLRKQESDLIFRLPYRTRREGAELEASGEAGEVLIYVLLEHQSRHDRLMVLRLLLYMAQLWAEQRRQAETSNLPDTQFRLIPVIPIIFYTGEESWTTPLDLAPLMELPSELARFVPGWETLFLNLHGKSVEELTRFSTAIGYALQVWQAENKPLAELEGAVREALTGLEGLPKEQAGSWLRVAWFLVLLAFHRRERSEYEVLLAEVQAQARSSKFKVREEGKQMGQTMAQYVEERGEQRGIQIGEQRGEQRGRLLTLRSAVATVLTVRFGELPVEIGSALEQAEPDQLQGWLERAATAESLNAVGILPTN
jgi:hypothetical protein